MFTKTTPSTPSNKTYYSEQQKASLYLSNHSSHSVTLTPRSAHQINSLAAKDHILLSVASAEPMHSHNMYVYDTCMSQPTTIVYNVYTYIPQHEEEGNDQTTPN